MWRILISEFFSDLRSQKTRAFLTMFAVMWGTITVVLLLAFGEGLKNSLIRGLTNAGDNIYMVYGGQTSRTFEGMPQGRYIRLTEDDMHLLLSSMPDQIEMASPSYGRWGVPLEVDGKRTTTYMEGVQPSFEEMRRMYPAAGGRFLNMLDDREKRRVVFMGDELARRLFGSVDVIGRQVKIDGLPFTVIGIMQPKMQTAMNNGPDAERAIIPASTFQTIYGHRNVGHLLIRPTDIRRSDETKAEIYRVLGRKHKFHPEDERALGLWDMIEAQRQTALVFTGIQIFLGVIGGLTLLIAGIGVANIMYVVVKERTREIGVKRALGARRKHIIAQFVTEATVLALMGGIIGLAISAAIVGGVSGIPEKEGAMEFLGNPEISALIALITVGTLGAIGLVAGVFPARKAAKVNPVDSLRWE
jgi:putative ABC transport system permease protein